LEDRRQPVGKVARARAPSATAEEIAAFALMLASDEHPYLTGAALVIDGGKTAHAG
jgi:NAD(P)-dependent dehydrogenase (short-subunit alcohol dehydrogenase family)